MKIKIYVPPINLAMFNSVTCELDLIYPVFSIINLNAFSINLRSLSVGFRFEK